MIRGSNVPKPRPAVIVDVARLAGVSRQTVSRVLNGSDQVHSETQERVRVAMTMLNYRPNPVARALATGRSKALGVITLDSALYGPTSALLAIERAAHDAGFSVSIASLRSLDEPSLLAAAEDLRSQAVRGILVIAPHRQVADAVTQLNTDIPTVTVEAGPKEGAAVVSVDQCRGAEQATQHLLDLGHKTVWHIAGPQDWLEAVDRVTGWRSALKRANVPVPDPLFGDWSAQSGYDLAAGLLADPGVTAVFAGNDTMALGLLRRVHEIGRPAPASISVVGFDDVPEAAFYTPSLTTVRQDFAEMGRRSFRLIVEQIETRSRSATQVAIPPQLIIRGSTGPAPDQGP